MNFKKVIISTICISSFMFTSLLSYADEVNLYDEYQEVDDSMELMEYITNSKSNISISSKGIASILCTVSGITKTEIKASLQRKVNNTWTTISTWSSTGSRTCTLSKTANVLKGYEYRVVSTAKAYKGSKSETKTIISNISKY